MNAWNRFNSYSYVRELVLHGHTVGFKLVTAYLPLVRVHTILARIEDSETHLAKRPVWIWEDSTQAICQSKKLFVSSGATTRFPIRHEQRAIMEDTHKVRCAG